MPLNALIFDFSILLMYLILKLEEDKPRLLQTPAAILKIGSKNLILKNTGVCRKLLGKFPRDLFQKIPVEKFPATKNPRDPKYQKIPTTYINQKIPANQKVPTTKYIYKYKLLIK